MQKCFEYSFLVPLLFFWHFCIIAYCTVKFVDGQRFICFLPFVLFHMLLVYLATCTDQPKLALFCRLSSSSGSVLTYIWGRMVGTHWCTLSCCLSATTHGWQTLGAAARQYRGPPSTSASLVRRPHWCSVCNKCYSSAAKLRRHQTMHYLQRKFYKCSYCPRRYSWMETLHVHMKRIHGQNMSAWQQ